MEVENGPPKELRERLKQFCAGALRLRAAAASSPPQIRILRAVADHEVEEEFIPDAALDFLRQPKAPNLRTEAESIAEWLAVSASGWPLKVFRKDKEIERPSAEDLKPWYAEEILRFPGTVASYAGSRGLNERAFEKAFQDVFIRKYSTTQTYRVVCPILGLQLDVDSVKLKGGLDWNGPSPGELKGVEISKLTLLERSAILTSEGQSVFGSSRPDWGEATFAIKIDVTSASQGPVEHEVQSRVIAALRLLEPEGRDLAPSHNYTMLPGRLQFRTGIPDIVSSGGSIATPVVFGPDAIIRGAELESFWEKHRNALGSRTPADLSLALDRLGQSYNKYDPESRMLDCSIILESTVMRDLGPDEGIGFRLALRSALLLGGAANQDPVSTFDFFRDFYRRRSNLVHKDQRLHGPKGPKLEPRAYVRQLRRYVTHILVHYLEQSAHGIGVQEVNQRLDQAALTAKYRP